MSLCVLMSVKSNFCKDLAHLGSREVNERKRASVKITSFGNFTLGASIYMYLFSVIH